MLMSGVLSNNQFVTIKLFPMDIVVSQYSTISDHTHYEGFFSLEESAQYIVTYENTTSASMLNIDSTNDQQIGSTQTHQPQVNYYDQISIYMSLQQEKASDMDFGKYQKISTMEPQKNKSSEKKNFPKFFIGDVIKALRDEKKNQQKNQIQDLRELSYLQFAEAKLNAGKKLSNLRELLEPNLQDSQILNEFKKFMKKNKRKFGNCLQKIIEEFNSTDLKQKIKKIILNRADCLIQMARKRQIINQNRKAMFITYVVDYLDNLKVNKIRRKDKKVKKDIFQKDSEQPIQIQEYCQ